MRLCLLLVPCAALAASPFALTDEQRARAIRAPPPGLSFSGIFSDNVVLQQGPDAAAVFGIVADDESAEGATVDVTLTNVGSGAPVASTGCTIVEALATLIPLQLKFAFWNSDRPSPLYGSSQMEPGLVKNVSNSWRRKLSCVRAA